MRTFRKLSHPFLMIALGAPLSGWAADTRQKIKSPDMYCSASEPMRR